MAAVGHEPEYFAEVVLDGSSASSLSVGSGDAGRLLVSPSVMPLVAAVALVSCLKRISFSSHLTHFVDPSCIVTKPSESYGMESAGT